MKLGRWWSAGLLILAAILILGAAGHVAGQSEEKLSREDPVVSPGVTVASQWDDMDSHKWSGAGWGVDEPTSLTWGNFHGRDCLEVRWDYPAWQGFAHTDLFPTENWEAPVLGLRAGVYVESLQNWTDIIIEPRDYTDVTIELLQGDAENLEPGVWYEASWYFTEALDYSAMAGLVFNMDQLGDGPARVYLDDIRLITAAGEEEWDDLDDGSRQWFYGGNWCNWSSRDYGLELVSHKGGNPNTPAGSVYLEWDYDNCLPYPELTNVEVGTNALADSPDWSAYNRISAEIKVSDGDVPISVFLWDTDATSEPVDYRGFGTPVKRTGVADTWQTVTWDLPWPPWFDNTGIDQVKFVVNDIDEYVSGTLYLDNIFLISDAPPPPVTGLAYTFEDFDDRNEAFNDFSGNWGLLNSSAIVTRVVTSTHAGPDGGSLRIDYDLPSESYAGVWQSLWGHSDYPETQFLDFTDIYGDLVGDARDFEQLQFWVRGSGATAGVHNVKIELKDNTGAYERTAYRYITIDDSDTTWRQVVLDADVTNGDFWSYNGQPPDPTRMKELVLVVESYFNNPTGTFYIDDIHFVDADDSPVDADTLPEDQFLDLVSQRTFLYFLDWYDPASGLFQDRSTFPDLMSTASTGFGLTALAIGESRGWIERPLAVEMITRTLHTLEAGQWATATVTDAISSTNGYKGFFYHFLDNDGLRKFNGEGVGSELSPVDTAILMAGILTARQHFDEVPEIRDLADEIYRRIEWDWMVDPANDWFYLAWKPEAEEDYGQAAPGGGYFSNYHWGYYSDEVILINLMAIGAPAHPAPVETFYAWERNVGEYGGHSHVHSYNGSFFTYVFAHLWVDFEARGVDNHPGQPVNWWLNSVAAAGTNLQFVKDHVDGTPCNDNDRYTTYGPKSWGLTAAEGPYEEDAYHAYGALPVDEEVTVDHDGTIAPYGAGMATMLLPEQAIPALRHYFGGTDLWRYRTGFGDAYSLDPPDCQGAWYNHAAFGIDQGPMLIAIENYRSGLVWDTFGRNPSMRYALCAIGHCIYLPVVERGDG